MIRGLVASRTEWSFLHKLASAVSVASGAPYAVCVARLFPRVLEAQVSEQRFNRSSAAALFVFGCTAPKPPQQRVENVGIVGGFYFTVSVLR